MTTEFANPSTFMKKNVTSVIFVIDSSGSMAPKQQDVVGGFNQYVKELRDKNEPVILSAITFNTESAPLFTGLPLDEVPELTVNDYRPAGNTALLDAIGDALKEYPVDAKVLVIIMTDGEENSSSRYTKAEIKQNIEYCMKKGQWAFIYLGSGIDAFAEAGGIGIPVGSTFSYNAATTGATVSVMGATTSTYAASPAVTTPLYRANLGTNTLKVDDAGNVTAKWKPQIQADKEGPAED